MAKATIVYATMTGNNETISEFLEDALTSADIEVERIEASSASVDDFDDSDIAIITSYTYGEGDLPGEISDLYDDLVDANLDGKVYGVVGSGDSSYDNFAHSVDLFADAFEKTGAKKGAAEVKVDLEVEDEDEEALTQFVKDIVASLD